MNPTSMKKQTLIAFSLVILFCKIAVCSLCPYEMELRGRGFYIPDRLPGYAGPPNREAVQRRRYIDAYRGILHKKLLFELAMRDPSTRVASRWIELYSIRKNLTFSYLPAEDLDPDDLELVLHPGAIQYIPDSPVLLVFNLNCFTQDPNLTFAHLVHAAYSVTYLGENDYLNIPLVIAALNSFQVKKHPPKGWETEIVWETSLVFAEIELLEFYKYLRDEYPEIKTEKLESKLKQYQNDWRSYLISILDIGNKYFKNDSEKRSFLLQILRRISPLDGAREWVP